MKKIKINKKQILLFNLIFISFIIYLIKLSNKVNHDFNLLENNVNSQEIKTEEEKSFFFSGNLNSITPAVHAASATLINNNILVSWFGGSKEGASDVKIYAQFIDKNDNKIDQPFILLTRNILSKLLYRNIKKLGNAVIWYEKNKLNLLIVSVSFGGWSGSSINFLQSEDLGKSWQVAKRLIASPFFNVSYLIRFMPIITKKGFIIPAYYEFISKYSSLLYVDEKFNIVKKNIIGDGIQPSIVFDANKVYSFNRNINKIKPRYLLAYQTDNINDIWQKYKIKKTNNPNSSLSVIKDDRNNLLMAFNNNQDNRNDLTLSYSIDKGKSWKSFKIIQYEKGAEFSYPFFIKVINYYYLFYTNRRKNISYIKFNQKWLNNKINFYNK